MKVADATQRTVLMGQRKTHQFVVRVGFACVLIIGLSPCIQASGAERIDPWRLSGTLSSDDVEHGFSRTLGDPGAQASILYQDPSGWFAGLQARTIDFVANELPSRDLFVSMRGSLGYEWRVAEPWRTQFSIHELYFPGAKVNRDTYEEVHAEVLYKDLLSLKVDYGHNRYTLSEDSIVYELSGHYPLGRGYVLDGRVGYHDAEDLLGDSYRYYAAGASKRFGPYQISLMYHETSRSGDDVFDSIGRSTGLDLSDITDPGFVLSFTASSDVFERSEWERWDGFHGFSSSVDLVSNYVSKGVSQTEDNPAVQLSVDYAFDNDWYAGVWVSNVDYVPRGQAEYGADFEVDLYVGYGFNPITGLALDLNYTAYRYPGIEERIEDDFDYGEWIFGATINDQWGLNVGYSTNQVASGEEGTWYQGTADFQLVEKLSLNIEAGYFDRSEFGNSYNWWGAKLAYDVGDFSIGVAVTQTSSHAKRDNTDGQADDKLIFSLSYAL